VIDFIYKNSEYVRQIISHKFLIRNIKKAFDISRDIDKVMKIELIL